MNSFYVSGYAFNKENHSILYFDKIVKTEKSRLGMFEISEIRNEFTINKEDVVFINLIYKMED